MSKRNRVSGNYSSSDNSSVEDNYMGSRNPKEILSNVRQQLDEKNKKLLEKKQEPIFYEGEGEVLNTSQINKTIYNPPEIKPNLNMLLGKVAPVGGGSASAAGGSNKVAPAPVGGGSRISSVLTGLYPASQHDYIRNLLEIQKLTPEGILKKYDKQALDDAINIIEDRQANTFKKAIPFKFVWPKIR